MNASRATAGLSIEDLSHAFGAKRVVNGVSLEVAPGEIACLLGPSGCGKTTVLRLAAGLERVQTGTVAVGGVTVAGTGVHIPPEDRDVGLMFQDYALFPHLTIRENVAFGLDGRAEGARDARVAEVLRQVNMDGTENAYPHMLSGGQQQRVALARALAPDPKVMLLDEPFSGLDETLRIQVREETLGILRAAEAAVLMVTHNPEEAMFMADRLFVMGPGGNILQAGTPEEVYARPAHRFVATFFGRTNRLAGTVQNGQVETPLGPVAAPDLADGSEAEVIVRTHGIRLDTEGGDGVPVDVLSARPMGRDTRIRFRLAGHEDGPVYLCRRLGPFSPAEGGAVTATLDPAQTFVFPAASSAHGK